MVPNIVADSGSSPLLTKDKANFFPGRVCLFHLLSSLQLVEKAKGFCYVHCPEKMCFMLAPALDWKEDTEGDRASCTL